MKELKQVTYNQFKCDFCSRIYRTKLGCMEHENKCYRNPNRNCPTCDNTGTRFFVALGSNGGAIEEDEICPSCLIAKEAGGKSYI
jgi:hypothetical protein